MSEPGRVQHQPGNDALVADALRRQPKTYSAEEVGEILGISRSTAYKLVQTGEIESLKIGSRRRITEAQLATFLGTTVAEMNGGQGTAQTPNTDERRQESRTTLQVTYSIPTDRLRDRLPQLLSDTTVTGFTVLKGEE